MTSLEYAAGIRFPHPRKQNNDPYVYGTDRDLLSAVDPTEIRANLALGKDDYSNVLIAAELVADQVRQSLWFPDEKTPWGPQPTDIGYPVPLDKLVETQMASCSGFVAVTSECLDAAGIEHMIGYANAHAVIVLSGAEEALYMLDPLTPELSQYLRYTTASGQSIGEDVALYGKSAVEINAARIITAARGDNQQILDENPWLHFGTKNYAFGGPQISDELERNPEAFRLTMALYQPEKGRRVLAATNRLGRALHEQNYVQILEGFVELAGMYPDLDTRNKHTALKTATRELVRAGTVSAEEARAVVRGYFASFVVVRRDSRVHEAQGDVLRRIGHHGNDPVAVKQAIAAYEQALQFPRAYTQAIAGKIAKATRLLERLDTGA